MAEPFIISSPNYMRAFRITVILLAVLAATVELAVAHPPYESRPILLDGDVEVVKSFMDGIFFSDPVKIVLRSAGQVRGETPYYRDASIACLGRRCLIAASDSALAIIPQRMWLVKDGSLRPADSLGTRLFGTVVHLWDHVVGYAFALSFGVPVVIGTRVLFTAPAARTLFSVGVTLVLGIATFILAVLWLYVVAFLSELSLSWAALIVVLAVCGGRYVRAVRANKRLHPSTA